MHVIQYTLKPERTDENARLVRAVFDELRTERPPGLRYACLRAADGVTCFHIVASEPHDGRPMTAFPAFAAFAAGITDRCAIPPRRVPIETIEAYDLFDE